MVNHSMHFFNGLKCVLLVFIFLSIRKIVRGTHVGKLTEGFEIRIGVDVLRNAREMEIEMSFVLPK